MDSEWVLLQNSKVGEGDPALLPLYLPGSVVGERSIEPAELANNESTYACTLVTSRPRVRKPGRLFGLADPKQRVRQGMHA